MGKELIEVNVVKEFANETFGDPILTIAVQTVLNNVPRLSLVFCEHCKCSDDVECPNGKVWCNKMCRYMNKDGFCSEGDDNNNETN